MTGLKKGDTVVDRGSRRGLRWRVTKTFPKKSDALHGFVVCERNTPGTPGYRKHERRIQIVAIYRSERWRKVA